MSSSGVAWQASWVPPCDSWPGNCQEPGEGLAGLPWAGTFPLTSLVSFQSLCQLLFSPGSFCLSLYCVFLREKTSARNKTAHSVLTRFPVRSEPSTSAHPAPHCAPMLGTGCTGLSSLVAIGNLLLSSLPRVPWRMGLWPLRALRRQTL